MMMPMGMMGMKPATGGEVSKEGTPVPNQFGGFPVGYGFPYGFYPQNYEGTCQQNKNEIKTSTLGMQQHQQQPQMNAQMMAEMQRMNPQMMAQMAEMQRMMMMQQQQQGANPTPGKKILQDNTLLT